MKIMNFVYTGAEGQYRKIWCILITIKKYLKKYLTLIVTADRYRHSELLSKSIKLRSSSSSAIIDDVSACDTSLSSQFPKQRLHNCPCLIKFKKKMVIKNIF